MEGIMGEVVVELAKAAIVVALDMESSFDLEEALRNHPQLQENSATFVTLTKGEDDRLRGCIGSLEAYRPLYKDIIANAKSAAFSDPRFEPLSVDELEEIDIEVSILTKPQEIRYVDISDLKKQIRAGIDGVVLEYNGHRATYLPQVWEQLPQFEIFFNSLCQKANLPNGCLEKHPTIKSYQVVKYKKGS